MGVSDYLKKSTTFTAHAAETSNFYAGSKLLQPLADSSGMALDQVNFVISLVISMILAILFRIFFASTSAVVKHLIELIAGVALLYFCFGDQIIYCFLQSMINYIIMRFAPPKYSHIISYAFCFTYLSATHIIRQIYDYGGYTLDVTLPMMMLTQRLTSLAFSVHDGMTQNVETLPPDQRFLAVQRFPSLLEYFSYTFYFHGSICGPFVHYADYISFIEGRNWTRFLIANAPTNVEPIVDESDHAGNRARPKSEIATVRVQLLHPTESNKSTGSSIVLTSSQLFSSAIYAGLKSLLIALCCGALMMSLAPMFPIHRFTDPEFHSFPFWYKTAFILGFITVTKQRYYFAWKFSDAINIFSGLSYTGVSESGKILWRLTDNIDIREFEIGTRFAIHINAWNKTTSNWLRFMIYDRAPWHPTLLTFTASALWHGFYPGYYIAFLTAVLFLQAVRVVRSTLRPLCETATLPRWFYDISAFILVRLASAYMALPFLMMTLTACYQVYSSLHFWLHILAVAAVFIVPRLRSFLPESMRQKKVYGRARSKKATQGECDKGLNTSNDNTGADSGNNDSDIDPMRAKSE